MPSSHRPCAEFLQAYDALPPDAQQLLVQKHLAPLLDVVSDDRRRKATASATEMQQRYAHMPILSLKAKKAEITALVLELSRDSKRAIIKERSLREQLLSEAVDSLARWLNDIWRVVFEFRTDFGVAHACLLFACDAISQIGNDGGGCSYASMFIPVKITRSTGQPIKSFMLNGAYNLENVALWIWRDLFMTILATGTKRQRSALPDMIDDIRILLGWPALEQLLRGGTKGTFSISSLRHALHVLTSFADEEQDDDDELAPRDPDHTAEWPDVVDDDSDQSYISDDRSSISDQLRPRTFYPAHWSWRIANQQSRLRDLIHTVLLDIFKVAPSGPLYNTMVAIADDKNKTEEQLHPLVISVAGHSSDNLSEALRILSINNRTDSVDMLLKAHKHLLRPQDAASLQFAVLVMSSNFFYRTHALSIVEEELLDATKVLHAAIRFSFCNIDSQINKTELIQILALRRDSLNRRTRVERWVKTVLTPQVDTAHPMALAAFMMGIPLPPGVDANDEGDMLGYYDLDGDHPEVEDLREEFRPNIKGRFHGWVEAAGAIKGGPALLLRIYAKIIVDMPFLEASDVVEEMSARISDRPSKLHVADALDAFGSFCQKQGLNIARREAKQTAAASTGRAGAEAGSSERGLGMSSVPHTEGSTSDTIIEDVD